MKGGWQIELRGLHSGTRDFCQKLQSLLQCHGCAVSLDNHFSECHKTLIAGILVVQIYSEEIRTHIAEFTARTGGRVILVVIPGASIQRRHLWQWIGYGVSDILFAQDDETVFASIETRLDRWAQVEEHLVSSLIRENMVGVSPVWQNILRELIEIAVFSNTFVLITGKSGTGKELAARMIQTLDPRSENQHLVVLDCTTIVPSLSGSELFGHVSGAFTGATNSRKGAFALADGGTLFLDEVGELPLNLQAELLRVIQEGTYKAVGSNAWHHTKFRLICATNRDLATEVAEGRFREDLYHRIAGWSCRLPSLSERPDDIPLLARHFANTFSQKDTDGRPVEFDPLVEYYLQVKDYHGNVRELQNLVMRIMTRHVGPGLISIGDLPQEDRHQCPPEGQDGKDLFLAVQKTVKMGMGLREIAKAATDAAIQIAVTKAEGNLNEAAKKLDVTVRTLQQRRKKMRDESDGVYQVSLHSL